MWTKADRGLSWPTDNMFLWDVHWVHSSGEWEYELRAAGLRGMFHVDHSLIRSGRVSVEDHLRLHIDRLCYQTMKAIYGPLTPFLGDGEELLSDLYERFSNRAWVVFKQTFEVELSALEVLRLRGEEFMQTL